MKPVGVFFATREGHTQQIAERLVAALEAAGLRASLRNLRTNPGEIDLKEYGAVILAASVHAGSHEPEMVNFVKQNRYPLEAMPNAFVSVTLSQVGAEDVTRSPAERTGFAADVDKVITKFLDETGWKPMHIKPVAGALPYSKYNFFTRFIMKRIARKNGAPTDTSRDYDFTNWADLGVFVHQFAEELSGVPSPQPHPVR